MEIDLEGLPEWCFESGKFSPDSVIKGLLRYGYVDHQGTVDPDLGKDYPKLWFILASYTLDTTAQQVAQDIEDGKIVAQGGGKYAYLEDD